MLKIADNLSLPTSAVTQTLVVYGGKGMGKTNFGGVFVEELSRKHLRFSVIDPLDVWWGLQHGITKEAKGIDVVILGGKRGDIPIEPTAGFIVADFVADETVSTVIVLRKANGEMWSSGDRIRFVTDYTTRLFARQGEQRIPLMQVIDEAGRFAPQTQGKGDFKIAECIGAIENLVEWGRNVGVGVTLITQRSARMAKSVSELADCMVAFRTVGPRSIASIVDWFGEHIPKERHKELVESLRKLPIGTALVVSPGWLEFEGEAQIRLRETFDSSATPKPGAAVLAPGKATKPDLEKYRNRMAETIEKAKAEDPKLLKAELAKTKRELEQAQKAIPQAVAQVATKEITVEVPIIPKKEIDALTAEIAGFRADYIGKLDIIAKGFAALNGQNTINQIEQAANKLIAGIPRTMVDRPAPKAPQGLRDKPVNQPVPWAQSVADPAAVGDLKLNKTQQRILDALAWYESLGNNSPSLVHIGAVALIDTSGGYFSNLAGPLSSAGLVERGHGSMSLTALGRTFAKTVDTPATLAEYHRSLGERVRKMKSAGGRTLDILETMIAANGQELTTEQIGQALGIDHTGGYFSNLIGPLSTAGLITRSGGVVRPTEVLFPEGLT